LDEMISFVYFLLLSFHLSQTRLTKRLYFIVDMHVTFREYLEPQYWSHLCRQIREKKTYYPSCTICITKKVFIL